MMQTPNRDGFGRGFEHALPLAREYCLEANKHFLDEYHVDGFRYDNIRGYYDDNPLTQYGTLAFATYVHSRTIPRFADPAGFRRILQIAEDLDNPARTLRDTFCLVQQLARPLAEQGRRHGALGLRRRQLRALAGPVLW
jgi:1,4-alpha-glucan branching enzyme